MNTDHVCYVTMKGDVLVQLTTYISNTTPLKYKTNNFFLQKQYCIHGNIRPPFFWPLPPLFLADEFKTG